MENKRKLEDFEKEYYSEIESYNVSEKDLIDAKVNPKFLAYEVYLRKSFGDSFSHNGNADDYDANAKRSVEKLTKDKLDNSELTAIIESIETSEFDDNLDSIIHSKG